MQNYLDFNGPVLQQIGSQNAGRFVQIKGLSSAAASGNSVKTAAINNPCPLHYMNEVCFLDKTLNSGACKICAPSLLEKRHELLPID